MCGNEERYNMRSTAAHKGQIEICKDLGVFGAYVSLAPGGEARSASPRPDISPNCVCYNIARSLLAQISCRE